MAIFSGLFIFKDIMSFYNDLIILGSLYVWGKLFSRGVTNFHT